MDPIAPFRLDGRVAVVTGASGGLGARFARVLHASGASVVLAARRKDRLDDLAAELAGAVPVACDVSVDADVERLAEEALAAFGQVDVLVNNAGITEPVPAEEESMDRFREVVAVNLTGTFALTQHIVRPMLERGSGVIVNVASVLGVVGAGQIPQASYAATKGAVVNLTRELGAEWARKGVRVNALAPGWFLSEMTGEMFGDDGTMTWIRRKTPMGRPGAEHELDGALLFLCSDASSYMTGQTLIIDGGWTAI